MTRLTLLLVAIIFALSVVVIHLDSRRHYHKAQVESYSALNSALQKDVETWIDKEGKAHARAETAEAGLQQVKDVIPEVTELRKQVSGLNKNLRNLEGFIKTEWTINVGGTAPLTDTVIIRDGTPVAAKHFSYRDDWNSLTGIISPDPSEVEFEFDIRDSLTLVSYWQGSGFLKPKKLMVHGFNSNPKVSITGLRAVSIKDYRPRKIGLGFFAGYGVSNTGLSPQIGIGAYYKLIEF